MFLTKEEARDFRARPSLKQLHNNDKTNDACRTVHLFLSNKTILREGTHKRVIIDEALILHAGEILNAYALANVQEALLVGDTNQIPYINRTRHNVTHYDITKLDSVDRVLNHSYRCTNSVTALLSQFYTQGMTTSNKTKKEAQIFHLDES